MEEIIVTASAAGIDVNSDKGRRCVGMLKRDYERLGDIAICLARVHIIYSIISVGQDVMDLL